MASILTIRKKDARTWLWLLPLVALTVFLFWPWFFGLLHGRAPFFEWDVAEEYWPDQQFLCRSLLRGSLPFWNPFDRGGYPWYADPQTAAFHPWSWLPCLFSAAPSHVVSDARVIASFLLAGVGTWLWLRSLDLSPPAALVGAVAFETCPFMRHNWEVLLTFGAAHVPWILFALERVIRALKHDVRTNSLRSRWVFLAISLAMLAWTGAAPVLWFGGSFVFVYALVRTSSVPKEKRLRAIASAGATLLLAFALASPSLVPSLSLARESVQAGKDFASIAEGGLRLSQMLSLFVPQSGNHFYLGIVVLLLAAVGFTSASLARGTRWFLLAAAGLGVAFSLGANAPIFHGLYSAIPPARWFRLPYRYELWLSFSAAPLAAAGFDVCIRALEARGKKSLVAPCALAISLLQSLDVSRSLDSERHLRGGAFPARQAPTLRVQALMSSHERYFDEFSLFCRSGTRLGRQEFRGYQDPLILAAHERVLGSLVETPQLLAQYGFPWIFTGPHFIHGWDHHYLAPPGELSRRDDLERVEENVYRWRESNPRAYLVDARSVRRVNERSEALSLVRDFAPSQEAVVETQTLPAATADAIAEPAVPIVQDLGNDDVEVLYQTPRLSLLVLNDVWYPGWRAFVDGHEVPVLRANALVRGVWVPAGTHSARFQFRPVDGVVTRWLWGFALALSLLLIVLGSRKAAS